MTESVVVPVTVAIEGMSDASVIRRVLELGGCKVHVVHGRTGKRHIDPNIGGYNNAARWAPWLVVRDQDMDARCAGELASRILPKPADWMRFRIAVRAIEAWLLADAEMIAEFLQVRRALVPTTPEALDDPKGALVNLARQSRSRAIRADMVPAQGTTGRVGSGYASRVSEFADTTWRPEVAASPQPKFAKVR